MENLPVHDKMTRRERVLRTARFEETDRPPVYDIFQNDALIEYYGAAGAGGEKLTVQNGPRLTGSAIGRTLDLTRMPDGPAEPGEFRRENGIVDHVERWTSWIVERPFHTNAEMYEWVKGEIRRAQAQQFGPTERAAFHAYLAEKAALFAAADPTGRGDPTVQIIESGAGLTETYHVLGWEFFATLMFEAPDLLDEWLDARNQAELRRVAAIADPVKIPLALTYDDIAYKTSTLLSPAWLRKHWIPLLRRLTDAWHARGALCIFHSDGNLWGVLDDLIGAGIDGLNPLEVLAGMDICAVRKKYPRLVLTGGIDVSQLLPFGTPDEVRAVCRKAIADTEGRGYFLGSTTELHWDVKRENASAMFETAWDS